MAEHKMEDEKKNLLHKQLQKTKKARDIALSVCDYVYKKSKETLAILKGNVPKALSELWSDLTLLCRLLKAYWKRDYKEAPVSTIIAAVVTFLYFISLIDIIPDFIPLVGYLDDAAMIALCLKLVKGDIEAFHQWEQLPKEEKKMFPTNYKCGSCGCTYTQTCTGTLGVSGIGATLKQLFTGGKSREGLDAVKAAQGLPGQCPSCGSRDNQKQQGLNT